LACWMPQSMHYCSMKVMQTGNSVPFSNVSGLGKGTNWQKRF
jgi:hypothetical protein